MGVIVFRFKKLILIFSLLGFIDCAGLEKSGFSGSIGSFASSHPYWTAYLVLGGFTAITVGSIYLAEAHDLKVLKELQLPLNPTDENIECSLYAGNYCCKEVERLIQKYNSEHNSSRLEGLRYAVNAAISELERKKELSKDVKEKAIKPYVALGIIGIIGTGINWLLSK